MNNALTERNYVSTAHTDNNFELYHANLFPEKIFGDADAKNEWNNEKYNSYDTFVHIESYECFKDYSALFLLGRRGTGKTSIIKMLDHEINNNKIVWYNYSGVILQEETFPKLTRMLRSEAFNDLKKDEIKDFIKDKWTWIVYVTAMVAVLEKDIETNSSSDELKKIHAFLEKEELLRSKEDILTQTPLQRALAIFERNLERIDCNPLKIAMAISRCTNELFSQEFKIALNTLSSYLKENKRKVAILIDSKETYEYNDSICDCVSSALMDCVLDVFSKSNQTYIYSKVAFPSEMYPHFTQDNKGKTLGKTLFIMWKYDSILALIAKRYRNLLAKDINEDDDLDNAKTAKAYLMNIFPQRILSYSGIYFDSISYIIGHTQKKPRQIIQLFNIILTLARDNKIPFSKLTEICIKEGCNIKLELLSEEAFDMYSRIFPKGNEIICKTFTKSNNILLLSDIHKRLKESSGTMQQVGMDKDKAVRLFLECGLLGILKKEHVKPEKKTIITAIFEYQVKEILTITNQDILVVHPMFYQPLGILADNNSMIYPTPTPEEKDELELLHMSFNN